MVQAVEEYAIFMLDPNGRIVTWNDGAKLIKGYGEDDVIGRHFSCFYPKEDIQQGRPEQVLKSAMEKGHFEEEGWRVRKDGTRFWAHVAITALRDGDGNLRGFTKVTRDITKRRQLELQLNDALRAKDVLLREIHHRVRNNLQVMSSLLRLQSGTWATNQPSVSSTIPRAVFSPWPSSMICSSNRRTWKG